MDLVRFIEETLNGKLHFLFSDLCVYVGCFNKIEGESSGITYLFGTPMINTRLIMFQ